MFSEEFRGMDMGYRQTHHYVGAIDSICCSLKSWLLKSLMMVAIGRRGVSDCCN